MPDTYPPADLRIEGKLALENADSRQTDLKLTAYVFDRGGHALGQADVDPQGNFSVPVNRTQPDDVELFVAPAGLEGKAVRLSATYSRTYAPKDWTGEGGKLRIRPDLVIPAEIWQPWRPVRVCVSGRIRKVHTEGGQTQHCPVSFVKVEVFDVDREGCWWPYLQPFLPYLDKIRVLPIETLINPDLFHPVPGPDPGPDFVGLASLGSRVALNPQPLPPGEAMALNPQPLPPSAFVSFNPQPDPPAKMVGEVALLSALDAARVSDLTLTSAVAPWFLRPHCFYTKTVVCTTFTDCGGYYKCCFPWFPFHWRRGRLRFDALPDIIVKVTQTINGVERVIYLDPYTSTRWNVRSATINLDLDDARIVCGVGCGGTPLPGTSQASILQIGSDPVWDINQTDGMYTRPPVSNAPYGGSFNIYGNFSADLKSGSPVRYYKLSYAPVGSIAFLPIQTPLSAERSVTLGTFATHHLGPQPSGPAVGLYEVRDTNHWWLDTVGGPVSGADVLVVWDTTAFEADQGAYTLRLEVFDQNGVKLPAIQFPNHGGNGSGKDPAVPPVVVDHLDITIAIDNRPMRFGLTTPATNACGVIKWTPTLVLDFLVHADQPHGRVNSWALEFVKGIDPTRHPLGSATYNAGSSPVNVNVSGAPLLVPPITTTCAYALALSAYIHVRGNWGFIWYGELLYAIAIERCTCP